MLYFAGPEEGFDAPVCLVVAKLPLFLCVPSKKQTLRYNTHTFYDLPWSTKKELCNNNSTQYPKSFFDGHQVSFAGATATAAAPFFSSPERETNGPFLSHICLLWVELNLMPAEPTALKAVENFTCSSSVYLSTYLGKQQPPKTIQHQTT